MADIAQTRASRISARVIAPRDTWLDRFRDWRTAKIANPAFRQFAQRFPLTRPIANRHANKLYALTAGFIYTQVLRSCIELDLFETLQAGPASLTALALQTGISSERLERLLKAAEHLDLVRQHRNDSWSLADTGAVVATNPGIQSLISHHSDVYEDIADLTGLLREPERETITATFWSYVQAAGGPDQVESTQAAQYSELMRTTQDMVIDNVLDAYDISSHETVLDVGGGSGAFVTAVATKYDAVKVSVFDLPPVAEQARQRLANAHFADRLTIHGGSFFDTQIPDEADFYSLVRVLYDHDDDAAIQILRNIRRAMKPGDTLMIAEPMAGTKAGERHAGAYFHIYLLAMRSGRCRSAKEHFALLNQAGYRTMRHIRTNLPVASGLVIARA